jgi:hypothetical protein
MGSQAAPSSLSRKNSLFEFVSGRQLHCPSELLAKAKGENVFRDENVVVRMGSRGRGRGRERGMGSQLLLLPWAVKCILLEAGGDRAWQLGPVGLPGPPGFQSAPSDLPLTLAPSTSLESFVLTCQALVWTLGILQNNPALMLLPDWWGRRRGTAVSAGDRKASLWK